MTNHPVDILVTDVIMPGMSGSELATRLQERRRDLPISFITGYAGGRLDGTIQGIGRASVLTRPFECDDLGREIRALLDHDEERQRQCA